MKSLITISLIVAVLLCSCTQCVIEEAKNEGDVSFSLKFSTRTADESSINNLRVVVVAKSDSRITCNKTYSGEQIDTPAANTFSVDASARPGLSTVYVIANEPAASTAALDAMTEADDLLSITIPFTPLTAINADYGDIPMMGRGEYDISPIPSMNHIQGIKLERLLTKISMRFKAPDNFADKVIITGVQLGNAPKYSYLLAQSYNETAFAATVLMPTAEIQVGASETTPIEFYAPEYLVVNEALRSYVTVTGKRVDNNVVCTYTVPLGENTVTDAAEGTSSNLIRNSHYSILGTIKGYGHIDLDIQVSVSPWNRVDGGSELGDMLDFSKITTTVDDKLVPIADGGYVHIQGETISVHCKTNVGGWYALTYKGATLVHTSATTDVISSSTVQNVDIVLPATTSDISVEYTIKLHHPKFAPESGEPFKTLTIKQDGGVIPNSVLVKSFEVRNTSYAGWSVDEKLPKRGLQLTKRGNVLPSGTALSDDPIAMWSTELYDIKGTGLGCGFGKDNTKKLLDRDAATTENYPAVNKCKTLGDGWYLPSRDELLLIYANKSLLGSSYTFNTNYYWSATQHSTNFAWYVSFDGGSTSNYYKLNYEYGRFRCVKNI